MKDYETIEVSKKRLGLRITLFVLALVFAGVSFSRAFTSLGVKDRGFQTVSAMNDAEAPFYAGETTLQYYFEGTKAQIRQQNSALSKFYSTSLARAYKLLDPVREYDGYVNLATLNASLGKDVQVGSELFSILVDAFGKTMQGRGFSMFSGALYGEWDSILTLRDPSEFDPLVNENQALRISEIASRTSDLTNFSFTVVDDSACIVRFDVSSEYLDFLKEMEVSAPILDMNVLRDAYQIQILASSLIGEGYDRFVIETTDGCCLVRGNEKTLIDVYALMDSTPAVVGQKEMKGSYACSGFRAFGMGNGMYSYQVETPSGLIYRSRWFDIHDGSNDSDVLVSYLVSPDSSISDLVFENINYVVSGKAPSSEAEHYVVSR